MFSQIVEALPEVLSNATRCDRLFELLRNTVFQNSLFLSTSDDSESWPQVRIPVIPLLWLTHPSLSPISERLRLPLRSYPPVGLSSIHSTFEENLKNFSRKECSRLSSMIPFTRRFSRDGHPLSSFWVLKACDHRFTLAQFSTCSTSPTVFLNPSFNSGSIWISLSQLETHLWIISRILIEQVYYTWSPEPLQM